MLKKVCISFIILILILSSCSGILLFTKGGNDILKPFLRDIIYRHYSKDIFLKDFRLSLKTLKLTLEYKKILDIIVDGDISLWNQKFDLNVNGKSKAVKNAFSIDGEIHGGYRQLYVKLASNIASSTTDMIAELNSGKLARFYLQSKNLNLEDMFLYLGFDRFMYGRINTSINLDTRLKKQGDLHLDLFDVYFSKNLSSIAFFDRLLKTKINGSFNGVLLDDYHFAITGGVKTPFYTFELKDTKGSVNFLSASYSFDLPSVKQIDGKIKRDFAISGNGSIDFDQFFRIDFITSSLGGNTTAQLETDKLQVDFENVQLDKIFAILGISQDLHGDFEGTFDYAKQNHIGNIQGQIKEFSIKKNKFFDLIYQYTKFDIQKEVFSEIPLNARLQDRKLYIQDIDTKSQNMQLTTKQATLDFKSMRVNIPMTIGIKNSALNLRVFGLMQSPKAEFKLGDILRLDKRGFLYNFNF